MLKDAFVPPGISPPEAAPCGRDGVVWLAARWTAGALEALAGALAERGGAALAAVSDGDLLAAWQGTVAAFLDPASPERQALDPALAVLCRLSPEGLEVALSAILGGVADQPAARILAEAAAGHRPAGGSPVLVVLASNLPALAVQPLLPALALRRPVLVKSATAEPLFAAAFLAALAAREPRLAPGLAAAVWRGGDAALEAPALAAAGTVLAYGGRPALDDLARRAPGKVVGYGPKTSLAIVGAGAHVEEVASGLARDVALFDQRGCLSVGAIYTAGSPAALAEALARELAVLADLWPPGPVDPAEAGAVQQLQLEAELRGLLCLGLPLGEGLVVVDPDPRFRPSPGLRTVRVHPLPSLADLPEILAPWSGSLQGAALAGADALDLAPALAALGVSRCTPPGELQSPDAAWHNGGVHPLAALAG